MALNESARFWLLMTHKGWINRPAIYPDHRRKGYAAQLIAAAEQELRKVGVQISAVLVEADNNTSQELFCSRRIQDE